MKLDQFASECESRPALSGPWQTLSGVAHRLISKQIEITFDKKENGELARLEEEFERARQIMQAECDLLGFDVRYEDLSARSFANWILRY